MTQCSLILVFVNLNTLVKLTRILAYIALLIVMIIFSNRLFFNISTKIPIKITFVTNPSIFEDCTKYLFFISVLSVPDNRKGILEDIHGHQSL